MTERIFEVEISNKTSKGYETATALEMPATWAEFHDALEKARIKDARDCHNELTKIEYPGIQRGMIGDNVNLYELNLLAQRLAMLSEDDRMGLDGLLQIEGGRHIGPIPLPRLINLTYNADICLLAPHVFNNQQLGALLYESGMLTQEAMTLLDTTEDGSAYRKDLLEVFADPIETRWLESIDLIRAAQSAIQAAKLFLLSSPNGRGSLPICQDIIAGSSLYFFPVYRLTRFTT